MTAFRFIPPCNPIRAKEVAADDGWLHELPAKAAVIDGEVVASDRRISQGCT